MGHCHCVFGLDRVRGGGRERGREGEGQREGGRGREKRGKEGGERKGGKGGGRKGEGKGEKRERGREGRGRERDVITTVLGGNIETMRCMQIAHDPMNLPSTYTHTKYKGIYSP